MILYTNTIKMFKSLEAWRGNSIGNGSMNTYYLRCVWWSLVTVSIARATCLVALCVLVSSATRSSEYTINFFQALVTHIDDEINMLHSFGLPSK